MRKSGFQQNVNSSRRFLEWILQSLNENVYGI
jgi:hypothetical protein